MAEKRGETEKMVYDFNTAGVLEVYMPRLKDWYRVTKLQLDSWGAKYHKLITGEKPAYDLMICDKTKRIEEV